MNYLLRTTSTVLVAFSVLLFAANPTKTAELPAHKKAALEPAGHDIVPGYIESTPINDVIQSAEPAIQAKQNNRVISGPSEGIPTVDIKATKKTIENLLRKFNSKQFLTNEEMLVLNEYFESQNSANSRPSESGNSRTALSEGFEGTTFPPTGWQAISNNTINSVTRSTTYAHSGTASARFSSYNSATDYTQYLILPKLTVETGDSLSFWYRRYTSGTETFSVGISTTDSSVASFTFGTATTNASTTWQQFSQDLSSNAGQNIWVAIKYSSNYMYYLYIDDIAGPDVWVSPNPVSTLSATSLSFGSVNTSSSSSKTFSVTNSGGSTLTGTVASNATQFAVSPSTLSVESGATATITVTYTPSAVGAQSGQITLTHNASSSPQTVSVTGTGTNSLIVEGFENDAWVGTPSAPPGWSQITVSGTNVWQRYSSTTYAHTGSYSAKGPWATLGGEHLLITPALNLGTGTNNYKLVFWLRGSSSAGTDLYVQMGSSNSAATDFTTTLATYYAGTNMPTTHTQQLIDLTGYTGTKYLAFRMVDLDGYSVYIDDVEVELIPPTPTLSLSYSSLTFSPVTIGSTASASAFTVGTNTGAGDLVISSVTSSNSDFSATPVATTISGNGSVQMNLSWTPTTFGMKSSNIIIAHNGSTSPDTISLKGESGYQYVNFNDQTFPAGWTIIDNDGPNAYGYEAGWNFYSSYGPGYGGYYARSHFNIDGADDWMITSKLSVVAGDSVIFRSNSSTNTILADTLHVYASTTGDSIAAFATEIGEIISLGQTNIRSAISLGAYSGQDIYLAIVHHGSVGTNYYSYRKVDDILLPAKWINPDAEALLSATELNYGGTYAGYARTKTLSVTNNGAPSLVITNITSDNAAVTVSPTTATLTYGNSANFTVTLTPSAVNETGSATLAIVSNDATNPTVDVSWTTAAHDLSEFLMQTGLHDTVYYNSATDWNDAMGSITNSDSVGLLLGADVFVHMDHTYVGDLEFSLVSPDGAQHLFFDNLGGSADNVFTVFMDGGTATAPPYWPDVTPQFSISDFVAFRNPGGQWSLNIHDIYAGDLGVLYSWGIKFNEGSSGVVSGTVTDSETGAPLDSAVVSTGNLYTYTDNTGAFSLTTLSGEIQVIASKAEYIDAVFTINLQENGTATINAALVPLSSISSGVYATGFETGEDEGWTYTGGTVPFAISSGFTFIDSSGTTYDTINVNPASGSYMMAVNGYLNGEFSWWMNLTDSDMDLSSFSSAELKLQMNYMTESGWDFVILLATMPDIYGGNYYYLDVNGDGVGNDADKISGNSNGWTEVTADLSVWTGTPYGVEIAVLFTADGSVVDGFGVAIDDVEVTGFSEPRPWPNDLTAESFVNDQIALSWSEPTGGQRRIQNTTITMNRTPVTVDPRNPRKAYEYEIGQAELILNMADNNDRDLVGYNVFRAPDRGAFELVGSSSTAGYVDTAVDNYKRYFYFVTAVYNEGESYGSNMAIAGAGAVQDVSMAEVANNFESNTLGTWSVVNFGNNGWSVGDSASAGSAFSVIPDNGGHFAYVNDDAVGSAGKSSSQLISPFFNIGDETFTTLSFDYYNEYTGQTLDLFAWVGWDSFLYLGSLPPMNSGWRTVNVNLPVFPNTDHVRVSFEYDDAGGWQYSAAVDNISVGVLDGPTNLTATATTEAVSLSWDFGGRAAARQSEYPELVPQWEKDLAKDLSGRHMERRFGSDVETTTDRNMSRVQGDSVSNPFIIDALPFYAFGSTVGYTNDYDVACPYTGSTAPDVVYQLTLAEDSDGLIIGLCESYYDTKVYVFANGDVNNVLGCSDDFCTASHGQQYTSYLELTNVPAGTYHIVVDGYGGDEGDYDLYIEEMQPLPDLMYNVYKDGSMLAGGMLETQYVDATATLNEACYEVTAIVKVLGTDGYEESYVSTGASNEVCASLQNLPPGAFNLLTPSDNENLVITEAMLGSNKLFAWGASVDPNGSMVTYNICFSVQMPFDQFCEDNGTGTAHFVAVQDLVDYIDSIGVTEIDVQWTVYASDGADETEAANGPRSMHIDAGWVLGVYNDAVPAEFALHQNFPNPFNPVTNIRFDIPEEARVTLDIYNVTGQKVATLINATMKPGFHTLTWNGTNERGKTLASGMYFYRLTAGDFTSMKKLVLMK